MQPHARRVTNQTQNWKKVNLRNLVPQMIVVELPTAEQQGQPNGHPKIEEKRRDAHLRPVIVRLKRKRITAASGTCGSFVTPAPAQSVQKRTTEK